MHVPGTQKILRDTVPQGGYRLLYNKENAVAKFNLSKLPAPTKISFSDMLQVTATKVAVQTEGMQYPQWGFVKIGKDAKGNKFVSLFKWLDAKGRGQGTPWTCKYDTAKKATCFKSKLKYGEHAKLAPLTYDR